MDPISARMVMAAAGAGAAGSALAVEDVFSTFLYEGTGGSPTTRTITNGIDLAGEGGMVWFKRRDNTVNHIVADTERGPNLYMSTNNSSVENTDIDTVRAFNSDGFDLGKKTEVNGNGGDLASWTFRKAPGFFDVVTYTGNGTAGRTISHNLGSAPGMIWVKSRTNGSGNWIVYHRSEGATKNGYLDENLAFVSSSSRWNNTEPTATNFTVGDFIHTNGSGEDFVAYIFAHDDARFGPNGNEDIIKCGSYTGNGLSSSGPIISLGWEPQWVMIKRTDDTGNWVLLDTARGIVYAGSENYLGSNVTTAEAAATFINLLPTGFELKTNITPLNASGGDYIYMAIRRSDPAPEDGTDFFQVRTRAGTGSDITSAIDFNADSVIIKSMTDTGNWILGTRGFPDWAFVEPNNTDALATTTTNRVLVRGDEDSTITIGTRSEVNASGDDYVDYIFKRARGAFDTVFYTGTGTAQTIDHGLGAVPKMMWTKNLDGATDEYLVYHEDLGNDKALIIDTDAAGTNSGYWNNTSPTSTQFTVGTSNASNGRSGDNYVAWLFGEIPGIMDMGSYTGTGTAGLQIDCGFTAGARFVLIKRTSGTRNWFVFDTARGIASRSDFLRLDSISAEVSSTSSIRPYAPGFEIEDDTADLNSNNDTYIYMAIA